MTTLELAAQALTWLSREWLEHQRSNHLHRESLAQALRVHEAEQLAQQEYHRVSVHSANDQHAREVLQSRYQHEEDIDNERRVATRENIRADWRKLSDHAETFLIVNALALAVAFSMLIEGNLPESSTWTLPVTTVAYFCAVSSSLCLLISSIRFAVVLRFRVGCTIVNEMREAIARTTHLDDGFRRHSAYLRCNRPETTVPACDARSTENAYQVCLWHICSLLLGLAMRIWRGWQVTPRAFQCAMWALLRATASVQCGVLIVLQPGLKQIVLTPHLARCQLR